MFPSAWLYEKYFISIVIRTLPTSYTYTHTLGLHENVIMKYCQEMSGAKVPCPPSLPNWVLPLPLTIGSCHLVKYCCSRKFKGALHSDLLIWPPTDSAS